jgi:hypothetical protein
MNPFERKYPAREVLLASGMTNAALQTYIRKGLVTGHKGDLAAGSPGKHRQFSFSTVMELAVAQAILKDIPPRNAAPTFKAAAMFAHVGTGARPSLPEAKRWPALPFHPEFGNTVLATDGERTVIVPWHPEKQNKDYPLYTQLKHELGNPVVFLSCNVSIIFQNVCDALGFDVAHVLNSAYGKDASADES